MSKFAKRSEEGFNLKRGLDFDVPVNCSICLELLNTTGPRAKAKLKCGHEFHLDCIGSTFNVKGIMECPNCRDVEMGQWLYANGSEDLYSDETMNVEPNTFFVVPTGYRYCYTHGIVDRNNVPVGGRIYFGNRGDFIERSPPPSPSPPPPSPPRIIDFTSNFRAHPPTSSNPNDYINGIQMNGRNHQQSNNLGGNLTQLNIHTTTVFFGHTSSSSQGESSYIPFAANQNPSMNMFAFGRVLPQYQFNNPQQPVTLSAPFSHDNVNRREFNPYNPTPYDSPNQASTSYNPPRPRGNNEFP